MASTNAPRDANFVPAALFEKDGVAGQVMPGQIDPLTGRILVDATGGSGTGTVTTVSVVSANGFAGTVANPTTTPAITLTTTITGLLKGNATAISAATAGSDYAVGSLGLAGGQTIAGGTLTTQNLTLRANAADLTTGQVNVSSTLEASSTAVGSLAVAGGLAVAKRVFALDMTVTNTITGSITGNAGTATALTSRTLWGQAFDGTGNVTGSLTAVGNITGGASNMTILSGTGASRTLILQTTTAGSAATTALTLNADQTATFAAGATIGGTLALGANSLTMTGSLAATGARITKGWFTDVESTNMPTVGGTAILTSLTAPQFTTIELGAASDTTLARVSGGVISVEGSTVGMLPTAQTWTAQNKFNNIVDVNNAIAASGNAATVPVTFRLNTVTNNSAATLTITMATASAVDGQMTIVRILDSSAAAQTITWVNTENSTVSAPTTSNGSTTLFLTVGFIYNNATSKWRCIASA